MRGHRTIELLLFIFILIGLKLPNETEENQKKKNKKQSLKLNLIFSNVAVPNPILYICSRSYVRNVIAFRV